MTARIACSACRAQFDAGVAVCPNCGLQLTAQALPVIPKRPWYRTFSGIFVILCALAALAIIASEVVK